MSVTPDYRIKPNVLTLSTSSAPLCSTQDHYQMHSKWSLFSLFFVLFIQSAPPVSLATPAPWRLLEAESTKQRRLLQGVHWSCEENKHFFGCYPLNIHMLV